MAVRRLLALLLHLQALAMAICSPCFPGIFNFGDSSSDIGGIQAAFPRSTPAEFPPYGITFPGKPALRHSDGRLGIDFICEALGLPSPSPFLQSVGSNYSHGANFASAGATAEPLVFITPFSLNVQLNHFREFKSRVLSQRSSSALPSADLFSKALYYVDIGGDDFNYGYTRRLDFEQVKGNIHRAVEGISALIRGIYEDGARTILVSGAGPQGCVPYYLTSFDHLKIHSDRIGCGTELNEANIFFNNLLKTELAGLRSQLGGAQIIYVNTYDIKYSLTANAVRNGFRFRRRACCGSGGKFNYNNAVKCGESKILNGIAMKYSACRNPSIFLNWDGIHYTEAANRVISREILSDRYFEPNFSLHQMCKLAPI